MFRVTWFKTKIYWWNLEIFFSFPGKKYNFMHFERWSTSWISFAPVFSFIYFWVLIFDLYLLFISWFICSRKWCIDKLGSFMQTKHLCVLIHIWTKSEVGALRNRFYPSSKMFYWLFQGGASFVDHLCYFCLAFVMLSSASIIDALRSPAGKGLASWLSFVMSNCEVVTFPFRVSWVRCGTWLYRFWIFALFLQSKCIKL